MQSIKVIVIHEQKVNGDRQAILEGSVSVLGGGLLAAGGTVLRRWIPTGPTNVAALWRVRRWTWEKRLEELSRYLREFKSKPTVSV